MTHDVVERMTGNRTRITQELPAEWHSEEDRAVETYLLSSARMDRANVWLTGFVPRGWLLIGLAGLAPAFLQAHTPPAALATGLGGLILGWQALRRFVTGAAQLAGAAISWKQVAPLFHAAAEVEPGGAITASRASNASETVLEAKDLAFRYEGRQEPVFRGIDFLVRRGDSILLEGASGGGKSTLGALVTGLRNPSSGLLLSGGLDRFTLGARAWQRRVACAPQYHENHVFTGSFAFNLLIGRHWPPGPADLEEASAICVELGLGPLLGRMPGGLFQMVGETGWQLSQGERSRLYMARALLQGADLVVLDESFAALDPENLRTSLECVLKRASTLLVIAHP
jgi:ATP-binding cassette subfamily B protein